MVVFRTAVAAVVVVVVSATERRAACRHAPLEDAEVTAKVVGGGADTGAVAVGKNTAVADAADVVAAEDGTDAGPCAGCLLDGCLVPGGAVGCGGGIRAVVNAMVASVDSVRTGPGGAVLCAVAVYGEQHAGTVRLVVMLRVFVLVVLIRFRCHQHRRRCRRRHRYYCC